MNNQFTSEFDDYVCINDTIETESINGIVYKAKVLFENGLSYCGIVINAETVDGWKKDCLAGLWNIECNYPCLANRHLTEIANELLQKILEG